MPVRKRKDRRSGAGDAWAEIFEFGFDMLHRASWLGGVKTNDRLEPDREEAREAWNRYGAAFIANYESKDAPYALAEFGPHGGRHAR